MPDYLLLMHSDTVVDEKVADWSAYLGRLEACGVLRGGSAIGAGACVRRGKTAPPLTAHLAGFVRIEARDMRHARELVEGNPVFEAGGTVEIRELPRTD